MGALLWLTKKGVAVRTAEDIMPHQNTMGNPIIISGIIVITNAIQAIIAITDIIVTIIVITDTIVTIIAITTIIDRTTEVGAPHTGNFTDMGITVAISPEGTSSPLRSTSPAGPFP